MRMISQTLDMGGAHVVAIGNIPSTRWFQGHPNGKSRLKVKFPKSLKSKNIQLLRSPIPTEHSRNWK